MYTHISIAEFILIVAICLPVYAFGKAIIQSIKEK
jgi:hypothetical protein